MDSRRRSQCSCCSGSAPVCNESKSQMETKLEGTLPLSVHAMDCSDRLSTCYLTKGSVTTIIDGTAEIVK